MVYVVTSVLQLVSCRSRVVEHRGPAKNHELWKPYGHMCQLRLKGFRARTRVCTAASYDSGEDGEGQRLVDAPSGRRCRTLGVGVPLKGLGAKRRCSTHDVASRQWLDMANQVLDVANRQNISCQWRTKSKRTISKESQCGTPHDAACGDLRSSKMFFQIRRQVSHFDNQLLQKVMT